MEKKELKPGGVRIEVNFSVVTKVDDHMGRRGVSKRRTIIDAAIDIETDVEDALENPIEPALFLSIVGCPWKKN